ncbi:hypothetical protein D4R87_02020 [bacterium]|nr:MAG: hypothetical protein D4R87_02020 [bacterium]
MKSDKLKNVAELLEYGGGRFLVVEDGEPAFVVLDINEFKKINEAKQSSESALLKKINDDIEMWKEEEWDDEFDDNEEGFLTDELINTDEKQMFTDHGLNDDEEDEDDDIVLEEVDDDEDDYMSEEEKQAIIQSAMKKHYEEPVGLEDIPF